MTFPRVINAQQNPAVEGDFASTNPRGSVVAGEGAFQAGATGLTVARFAWIDFATGLVVNNGSGVPNGFIHRENQALNTAYLAASGMVIPSGAPVTVMRSGDYWVKTLTTATVGQKVYASLTTGDVKTGATGATVTGYIETQWFVDSAAAVGELIKISKAG